MPVFTQLERLDFTGKKVFPFMSHEGSGLGSCEKDIRNSCRGAVLGAGLEVQGTATAHSEGKIAGGPGNVPDKGRRKMAVSEQAEIYYERMFPVYLSSFKTTDPEFNERFDNSAFDEVIRESSLDDRI
jgi:hypothetical protein